jgi:hypothetical protein
MNPFSWSREHQLALLVAALIGAALATVLGYIVYAVGWGEGAVPFESWILLLLRGPIWWALFGAVIGGASIFVCILIRAPFEGAQLRTPIVQRGTEHSPQTGPHNRLRSAPQARVPIPFPPRSYSKTAVALAEAAERTLNAIGPSSPTVAGTTSCCGDAVALVMPALILR